MDTIDDIREALGAPGPRNGGRPGDKPPGGNGRGNRRPDERPAEFEVFSDDCTRLSRGRIPGRGLLYSFLFHEIAVFLLLLHPGYNTFLPKNVRPVDQPLFIDADLLKADLPPVGGGKAGGSEGKKKGSPGKKGNAAPGSEGHKGFNYPGPQPIASEPPKPDNRVQTIQQPDLVNPPKVKFELKLPNQVQIAAPKVPDAPKLKGAMRPLEMQVKVPPAPEPPPEVKPKLTLPPPRPEIAALPAALRKDLAQAAPKLSAPKPLPPKVLPSSGDQLRNLAVLSPIGKHTTEIAEIPVGEAHGAFAVGPDLPRMKSSEPGAGVGDAPGAGTSAAAGAASGAGAGAGGNGKGTDAGSGLEAGNGLGTGSASGTGTGREGTGLGAGGAGTGRGTGVGAGLGPGKGPFTGLSVDGGTGSGGSIPRGTGLKMVFGPDKPYGYGMNVEAQGPSGGLRDYGTFRDDISYTVFVDMSQPNQPPTAWTLQYSLLHPTASGIVTLQKAKAVVAGAEEHVLPPIPVTAVDPKLPPQVARQYPGHMLVVYAEISAEGRLEKLHVVESPDIELTQLVLQALIKWAFKPALEDGKPVAVKALFGVPLSPPEKAVDHRPVAPVDHKPVPPMVHKPAPPPLVTMKHAPEVRALSLNGSGPERAVTLDPNSAARAVTLDSKASARAVTLSPGTSGRAITLKPTAPGATKPAPASSAAPKKSGQKPEERDITLK